MVLRDLSLMFVYNETLFVSQNLVLIIWQSVVVMVAKWELAFHYKGTPVYKTQVLRRKTQQIMLQQKYKRNKKTNKTDDMYKLGSHMLLLYTENDYEICHC